MYSEAYPQHRHTAYAGIAKKTKNEKKKNTTTFFAAAAAMRAYARFAKGWG